MHKEFISSICLIVIGIIVLSGINLFGSAILEGAAWKQNVIFAMMIIFGMLPPYVQEMKTIWMIAGYSIAFFMFGGANLIGTVSLILIFEKIILAVLALFLTYCLWAETWKSHKYYMVIAMFLLVSVAMLFPIKDENIVGSGFNALMEWSPERFFSDNGFHVYLGLISIFGGISEFIICRKKVNLW